ncbi:MMPL family transporter [Actinomadura sp. DC4]|uniref:MMPL family transporter n=1 Tax=Actinomadura sp. DC4 TaxID=3055069 RepID=UPI0025AFF352|nr:MMPL family transporter [Actinomadura sp. DC4]MDN3351776.1 MMPL family transporter [Actinomadura sp. DC4]
MRNPERTPTSVAARLGGWSVRHRKTAIIGWLLFVIAASMIGGMVGQTTMKPYENGAGDSARAEKILSDAGIQHPAGEMVIVHSAEPGGWRDAAGAVAAGVRATGRVDHLQPALAARDGRDGLVRFDVSGDPETAPDRVQPVLDAVARVKAAHPEVTIGQFGDASSGKWLNDILGKDFAQAEWTAVPLALGILLIVFGALLAALLPVGLALTAFIAANGLLAVGSHALHVFDTTSSVMMLIGLAVGVDYCLFYIRRERDERAAGHDKETALRIAAATSGRSVLVSGLTVMLAMAGMFLSGLLLFKGFALATMLVVLIAMLGSVTVLPALLSLIGDKVEFGRLPFVRRGRGRRARGGRVSAAVLRPVLARPGIFALLAAGVLVVLAAPAVGMRTQSLGLDQQMSKGTPMVDAYQRITRAFPGGPAPAQVVVKATDIRSPQVTQAIAALKSEAGHSEEFGAPVVVTVHADRNVAQIDVPLAGDGTGAVSQHALATLRERLVPATVGGVATAHVTGQLAGSLDFTAQLRADIVPVFAFVMVVTFLLMLVSFRSVAVAVTAIVLNLLSVGAAYGVMVAVFQHGWGAGLFGAEPVGAIESWMPLFVFVVLFGLSMDYHVFVVSRIREARDRGLRTRDAVADGVRSSAGVVTSAAAIMVAVFAVFATLSMQDMKQMGVGLAVAVFLDATVVRAVLLPSAMALLGEPNWYLPRWLGWLPKVSHGDETATPRPVEHAIPVRR